jgi:hypothetical protein
MLDRSRGFDHMLWLGRIDPRPRLIALNVSAWKRRVAVRTTIVAVLSGAIAGCAVGPNFNPAPAPNTPGYVPGKLASPSGGPGEPRVAAQHFVTGADVSARWWSAFKSPVLNELVKQSVNHNPNLQAAEAAIKIAQYNALAQRGLFFHKSPAIHRASNS